VIRPVDAVFTFDTSATQSASWEDFFFASPPCPATALLQLEPFRTIMPTGQYDTSEHNEACPGGQYFS
jgi:hypothetical protein